MLLDIQTREDLQQRREQYGPGRVNMRRAGYAAPGFDEQEGVARWFLEENQFARFHKTKKEWDHVRFKDQAYKLLPNFRLLELCQQKKDSLSSTSRNFKDTETLVRGGKLSKLSDNV